MYFLEKTGYCSIQYIILTFLCFFLGTLIVIFLYKKIRIIAKKEGFFDEKKYNSNTIGYNENNFYFWPRYITDVSNTNPTLSEIDSSNTITNNTCNVLKNNDAVQEKCNTNIIDTSNNIAVTINHCYKWELCKNLDNYKRLKQLNGTFIGGYDGKDANREDVGKLYDFHIITTTNLCLGIIVIGLTIYSYYQGSSES